MLSKKQGLWGKVAGIVFICVAVLVLPRFFDMQIPIMEKQKPVNLVFVGDIMLSRQIEKIIYQEQDPLFPFLRTSDLTQSADIAFANLENPVSLRGENVGSIYSFRANPDMLKGLQFAGFDVVSIANNHMFDWGPDAFLDTLMYLDKHGIKHVGGGLNISEARKPVIIEKNGMKFAYLGFSQFATKYPSADYPAMAPLDLQMMKEDITKAKMQADVVVVSIHWGDEYATSSSEEQKIIAHELIDAGATIVAGHHPHVVQEVEKYHGGLIAYSLGNFVFDQNFSPDTRTGLMLHVTIDKKGITNYQPTRIQFTDKFQPFAY